MQTVQTGLFIGGCVDGMTYELETPGAETMYMVPPTAPLPPPRRETTPTRSLSPGDVYQQETLTIADCGIRLLFYRHHRLTAAQAFQMLFEHYGRKA